MLIIILQFTLYNIKKTTETIKNAKINLWTEIFGNINKPCYILIGRAGAISSFWHDTFCSDMVSNNLCVIRFDHRDTGNSTFLDFSKNPYGISDIVKDVLCILDNLGIKKAHIAGHSMGGFIAQLLAIDYPQRVLSLTSMSSHTSAPDVPNPDESVWEVMLANKPVGNFEADKDGFLKIWKFLDGEEEFNENMANNYTKEIYKRNWKTLPANNHVFIQTELKDRTTKLKNLKIPSLIIHGEKDPLVPVKGCIMTADAIPDSKLLLLPKAGHMYFNVDIWKEISNFIISNTKN